MMKSILLFLFSISLTTYAQIDSAASAYQAKNYAQSLTLWQAQLHTPSLDHPTPIYEQMGNCYFELQKYPEAILYYEKSLLGNYNQPNLKFNLKVCRARLHLDIDNKVLFVHEWLRKIAFIISSQYLPFIAILLSFGILAVMLLRRFTNITIPSFILPIVLILWVLMTLFYVLQRHYSTSSQAIIIATTTGYDDVNMKGKSKPIQAGEKVEISDQVGDQIQIRSEDDLLHWVPKNFVATI